MVGLVLQLLQGAASYRKREPSWTSELASKHVKRLVSVSLPSIPIHPSIHPSMLLTYLSILVTPGARSSAALPAVWSDVNTESSYAIR